MSSQTLAEVQEGPSGHLNTTWEIALITVFVVMIIVILGTVWFQVQRKKRRRQRMSLDAELGARSGLHSQSSREKWGSVDSEVTMPDRVADIPRHPKHTRSIASSPTLDPTCNDNEPSKKPSVPRYYWDSR